MIQYKNIHRRLIVTLFISWLILSLCIGGGVFFYEFEKIDEHCEKNAKHESIKLEEKYYQYTIVENTIDQENILKSIKEYLLKSHFILLELYDINKKEIIEVQHEFDPKVKEEIDKNIHKDYLSIKIDYIKYYINGSIYLQVFAPMFKDGSIIGYFEGIYKVDSATLKEIKDDIIWSLSLVVFITLFTTIVLYPIIISLNKNLIKLSLDLSQANIGMLEVLGNAISKRDSDTSIHNYRVTLFALKIGESLGLNIDQMRGLIKGAFLHDIGKIGISDNILLKPSKLTDEEFAAMKVHVQHGVDIICKYPWLADAIPVVQNHHEKYDGNGYLSGIKADEIPINARIFAISDVFDALTSKRPYKEPFTYEKAMEILEDSAGSHFDPNIIDTFKKISQSLYNEVTLATDEHLYTMLHQRINKYFAQI